MSNQERIKEYLLGNKEKEKTGYLKNDISNGKVIMLSGKWGSGKTHFWQNKIADDELKKELKDKREVYSYTSLYGKSSIEEIENDIFSQAYSSSIGGDNFITKGFSTFTKRMKRFGSSKIANGLKDEQKDNIERTALSRLNNGGIICFDDFERKSKDIDLNDLFGFITQLTLNFNCKVVIILNDDVFEGEEKNIFSNVKEKSVSKFLMYNPSIKELFDSIFDNNHDYIILNEYKEVILKTIKETKELNARIYIQVLDNLLEWILLVTFELKTQDILRCIILVNINFILYHTTAIRGKESKYQIKAFYDHYENLSNHFRILNSFENGKVFETFDEYYKYMINITLSGDNKSEEKRKVALEFIENNKSIYKSKFFINNIYIARNINDEIFEKINNFIETGILIDE